MNKLLKNNNWKLILIKENLKLVKFIKTQKKIMKYYNNLQIKNEIIINLSLYFNILMK